MRTRTLAILAMLAALCLGAWLALRSGGASAERVARSALFAIDEIPLERVDRVELVRTGGFRMVFERAGDGWIQREPFEHPADPASIREVIDVTASLGSSRAVDPAAIDPEARAALGLEPPVARITLSWPGGSRSVALGKRTVAGRAWARVDGRAEAVSVDAALHALAVDGDPRQWRDTGLWEQGSADIGRIEIRYGTAAGQRVVLARAAGKWRIESPVATRADTESITGYLDALARAQVDAFAADMPDDLGTFGLQTPERGVRILRAGAAEGDAPAGSVDVGVNVAEGAQERFARIRGRPTVVQLGNKALAAIFPPPAFFVDPRGCDAVPADVRAITYAPVDASAAPGVPAAWAFRLDRTLDAWTITVPGGQPAPADAERVRRLLAQLCEGRAPAVAFQRMPDALRVGEFAVIGAGDAPLARIRVAREPEGQWALDNDDGVLRVFPAGFGLALDAGAYAGNR